MQKILGIILTLSILGFGIPCAFALGDHSQLAESYDHKARQLDAVIRVHTRMKEEIDPKTPEAKQELEKHCDAIIEDAMKLRENYRNFASWHRMQAEMKHP